MTPTLLVAAALALAFTGRSVVRRRRKRYKRGDFRRFDEIRDSLRTGDIILFHKTRRTGFFDSLELDVISPVIYGRNEFRHCGVVLREGSELFVLECADELHSGYNVATYVTPGNGVRLVGLEALMREYARDNGDPHFGILHIAAEIPAERFRSVLAGYGAVNYLKTHRTAAVLLSHFLLPERIARRIAARYAGYMMCSEFLHDFLHRCDVLGPYDSKSFVTYAIENGSTFRALQRVSYSEIVRFDYQPA